MYSNKSLDQYLRRLMCDWCSDRVASRSASICSGIPVHTTRRPKYGLFGGAGKVEIRNARPFNKADRHGRACDFHISNPLPHDFSLNFPRTAIRVLDFFFRYILTDSFMMPSSFRSIEIWLCEVNERTVCEE